MGVITRIPIRSASDIDMQVDYEPKAKKKNMTKPHLNKTKRARINVGNEEHEFYDARSAESDASEISHTKSVSNEQLLPNEKQKLEGKLNKLKDIEDRLRVLQFKIEHSPELREELLARTAAFKWVSRLGYSVVYDQLAASKLRTRNGGLVESLMRILCELDEIESEGFRDVKSKRKQLVKWVNQELLPKADVEVTKAESTLRFTRRVLRTIENRKQEDHEDVKMTDVVVENKSDMESHETEGEGRKADRSEDENMQVLEQGSKEEKQEKDENVDKEEPIVEFKTKETPSSYLARIKLPKGETLQDIRFHLKSDNELVLKGKNFTLPIEANPRNAVLSESVYKEIDAKTILLTIPKRKRRVANPFYRYSQAPTPFTQRDYPERLVWGL